MTQPRDIKFYDANYINLKINCTQSQFIQSCQAANSSCYATAILGLMLPYIKMRQYEDVIPAETTADILNRGVGICMN